MTRPDRKARGEIGGGWLFIALVFGSVLLTVVWKLADRDRPSIQLKRPVKGIGLSTSVEFGISDPRHPVKRIEVELRQAGRTFSVPFTEQKLSVTAHSWWGLQKTVQEVGWTLSSRVGKREIPDLEAGRATLRITATNNSWGHFFRGGRSALSLDLPVRFTPPQVEVLTSQHYINQGGADMVMIRVSPGTVESGVQVGKYFFRSYPVKDSSSQVQIPEVRLCLFALPYDLDAQTPMRIVARDDAGNETLASFQYRVFPKKFRSDTIKVTDEFMQRVVPPILSQTPEASGQGSLLKDFLYLNGHLRQVNAQQLADLSKKTASHFLWTQPFLELASKVEASFADDRTYVFNGQVVDRQVHLGFDLAGLQHMPIQAANDGAVVFSGFLGIYGNAVVIDHGCGLQSLYGHLSSREVKEGDPVKRGQVIGRSGATGLAGGDHLHFTVLLEGLPVNPVEWWDPHWIHDRIEAKLEPYR